MENTTVLSLLAHPGILVQVMKITWGRYRYDDLGDDPSSATPPALYTPWYQINGPTGEKSFPSGHASMGAISWFICLFAPPGRPRALAAAAVFPWGFSVGFGRVVKGAHFASDVYFSLGVGVLLLICSLRAVQAAEQEQQKQIAGGGVPKGAKAAVAAMGGAAVFTGLALAASKARASSSFSDGGVAGLDDIAEPVAE